jgi:hypothetical protein
MTARGYLTAKPGHCFDSVSHRVPRKTLPARLLPVPSSNNSTIGPTATSSIVEQLDYRPDCHQFHRPTTRLPALKTASENSTRIRKPAQCSVGLVPTIEQPERIQKCGNSQFCTSQSSIVVMVMVMGWSCWKVWAPHRLQIKKRRKERTGWNQYTASRNSACSPAACH